MASGKAGGAFKRSQGYGGPRTDARIKGTKVVVSSSYGNLKKTPNSDVKQNILYNEIFHCLMINQKVENKMTVESEMNYNIFNKYYDCIYPVEVVSKLSGKSVNNKRRVFKPKTVMSDYLKDDENRKRRKIEDETNTVVKLNELSITNVFEKLKEKEEAYKSEEEKQSNDSIKQLNEEEEEEEENDYNQDYYADDADEPDNGSDNENSVYD